jgi:hypothetical protein
VLAVAAEGAVGLVLMLVVVAEDDPCFRAVARVLRSDFLGA